MVVWRCRIGGVRRQRRGQVTAVRGRLGIPIIQLQNREDVRSRIVCENSISKNGGVADCVIPAIGEDHALRDGVVASLVAPPRGPYLPPIRLACVYRFYYHP